MIYVFDMDDTLFDQTIPFKKALDAIHLDSSLDVTSLFVRSRYHSDLVFEKTQAGMMSLEAMRRYRIQKPLDEIGIALSDQDADFFQETYHHYQHTTQLDTNMETLLVTLGEGKNELYLLTNGPSDHQWRKINSLQLTRFFPREHIIVSGDTPYSKPDIEIFRLIEKRHPGESFLMIGDSLEADIKGAQACGWRTCWINHRERPEISSDITVLSFNDCMKEVLKLKK